MSYIALIDEQEVEFSDAVAVQTAVENGELLPDTWIKDADEEADWETVEEMFPQFVG